MTYMTENHIFISTIVFRRFDSNENDTHIANLFSCDLRVSRGEGGVLKALKSWSRTLRWYFAPSTAKCPCPQYGESVTSQKF